MSRNARNIVVSASLIPGTYLVVKGIVATIG